MTNYEAMQRLITCATDNILLQAAQELQIQGKFRPRCVFANFDEASEVINVHEVAEVFQPLIGAPAGMEFPNLSNEYWQVLVGKAVSKVAEDLKFEIVIMLSQTVTWVASEKDGEKIWGSPQKFRDALKTMPREEIMKTGILHEEPAITMNIDSIYGHFIVHLPFFHEDDKLRFGSPMVDEIQDWQEGPLHRFIKRPLRNEDTPG